MQILLEGRNPQEIRAQVLQLFPELSNRSSVPSPVEDEMESRYRNFRHYSQSKTIFVYLIDMNIKYLLNSLSQLIVSERRSDEVSEEIKALVWHINEHTKNAIREDGVVV